MDVRMEFRKGFIHCNYDVDVKLTFTKSEVAPHFYTTERAA